MRNGILGNIHVVRSPTFVLQLLSCSGCVYLLHFESTKDVAAMLGFRSKAFPLLESVVHPALHLALQLCLVARRQSAAAKTMLSSAENLVLPHGDQVVRTPWLLPKLLRGL